MLEQVAEKLHRFLRKDQGNDDQGHDDQGQDDQGDDDQDNDDQNHDEQTSMDQLRMLGETETKMIFGEIGQHIGGLFGHLTGGENGAGIGHHLGGIFGNMVKLVGPHQGFC